MESIIKFDRKDELNFYKILNCDQSSTSEQILKEYRVLALTEHPDKNQNNESAVDRFKLIQQAKDVLLDEKRRKLYDQWIYSGVQIPFKKWETMNDSARNCLHWRKTNPGPKMIDTGSRENYGQETSDKQRNIAWERDQNEILAKFRNYDI